MGVSLNPKDYEENGFEEDVSGSLNNQERTDYTDLDGSKNQGDGGENGGRGASVEFL